AIFAAYMKKRAEQNAAAEAPAAQQLDS
ncbi:MAG: hypothetical protein ACI9DQ_000335, partial [Glaciecola sp.]